MRLPTLVLRNLGRRRLATVLTAFSVALGVALFAAVGALREASERGFKRSASICDTVVGAKGSPLQLILNTLYHMGLSPGNVPYELSQELDDRRGVLWTVPIAVGDAYRGARIVGVTDTFFAKVELGSERAPLAFADGGPFHHTRADLDALKAQLEHLEEDGDHAGHDHGEFDAALYQAVVGAEAARDTGLRVGDRFVPAHDVTGAATAEQHTDAPATVVGVLKPTGTPIDRAIWVPLGLYYVVAGHQAEDDMVEGGARDPRGISGVLVRTHPTQRFTVLREVNDRLDAMAAVPLMEINNLFQLVGTADRVLKWIGLLVMVVALVGVMVAIYNTMGARRREFAVLRALGARRSTVLGLVTAEAASIAALGGVLGLLLAGVLLSAASGRVQAETGVALEVVPGFAELQLLVAVTAAGALAGLVPAWTAYRTEPARHLSSGL